MTGRESGERGAHGIGVLPVGVLCRDTSARHTWGGVAVAPLHLTVVPAVNHALPPLAALTDELVNRQRATCASVLTGLTLARIRSCGACNG